MQKTHFIALVLGASTLITAGAALAQAEKPQRPTFEQLDRDSDGVVTRSEMQAARADHLAEMDANGDGLISTEEFVARHKERAERHADRMLQRLDTDGDGQLSIAELTSEKRGMRGFDRVDANGDGEITREEFDEARANMRHRMGRRGHDAPQDN